MRIGEDIVWDWKDGGAQLRSLSWCTPVKLAGDVRGIEELYAWLTDGPTKSEDAELIEALRDEIDEKDEQIIALQERVETLEDEVEALRARLVEMEGDE